MPKEVKAISQRLIKMRTAVENVTDAIVARNVSTVCLMMVVVPSWWCSLSLFLLSLTCAGVRAVALGLPGQHGEEGREAAERTTQGIRLPPLK